VPISPLPRRPAGEPVAVEHGLTFAFGRHRLSYDLYGAPDRPLVVYMHGLLLDAQLNRGIAHALAEQGYRVALLDLLGHGRSDKPTHASEYRIDRYADQVIALLDHLGIGQAVLGGISLGANSSLFAAARYPERVRGLILEMPVLERAVPATALVFSPMVLVAHYGAPVVRWTSQLAAGLPRTPFGPLNSVLDAFSMSPEAMAAVLHGVMVGPVAPTREERESIEAPAIVVAHANDVIHPFDDAAALVDRLPHAVLVQARSPLELRLRPRRLTAEIVAFLDGLGPVPARRRRRTA
jgi:pimeloyl-ACP methyl ester carboxylesterase